jgi:hypothetical protein
VIEHMLRKCKALNSNPRTTTPPKKRERQRKNANKLYCTVITPKIYEYQK